MSFFKKTIAFFKFYSYNNHRRRVKMTKHEEQIGG